MATIKDTSAVNALTYSYAALTTGAQVVGQQALWTEQRIRSTVDSRYISSRLKETERSRLQQPLAFGDGLTDDTYLDFILDRAQRLYLALCEVGKSEHIFRAIDLSYDDGDLPLPPETVTDLGLAAKEGDKINRRFHAVQHRYLLRELKEGDHINYLPEETVPLEYVYKAAATHSLQSWIRVRVPGCSGRLMARRRLATSPVDDLDNIPVSFFEDLDASTAIEHDHIAGVWASYTSESSGYIITPFVAEYTLKSFFEAKYPPQFGELSKPDRQRTLLKWMHCLADALAYLHINGYLHTAITPSNIVVDGANCIAFSDVGCLKSFQLDKAVDPVETYDYRSPEANVMQGAPHIPSGGLVKTHLGSRLFRRRQTVSRTSSDKKQHESSDAGSGNDLTPSSTSNPHPDISQDQRMWRPVEAHDGTCKPKANITRSAVQSETVNSEKSDIFSLGCIFVDILSYMHKFRATDVSKRIRSARSATRGQMLTSSRYDTSFHANLPRVNSWLDILEDIAFENDHTSFRAVPQLNHLIRAMLCPDPSMRPSAPSIRDNVAEILIQYAKIRRDDLHCKHQPEDVVDHKYLTNKAPSVPSFGARSSGYTSSSQYASTNYSGASIRALGAQPREAKAFSQQSEQSTTSPPLPWATFPTKLG